MPPLDDFVGSLGKAIGGGASGQSGDSADPIQSLLGVLGGEAAKVSPDVASAVLGMIGAQGAGGSPGAGTPEAGGGEGLDSLIGALKDGGLGDAADSWVSTGPNKPVGPDELGKALGPDRIKQLSAASGLKPAELLPQLAAFLPELVNALTPNGKLPDPQQLLQGGLGGLLGNLLGGIGGSR